MKKNKLLLIPFTSIACAIPLISTVCCNKQKSQEEQLASFILDPLKVPQQQLKGETLNDKFNAMSEDDKVKEVIYDLFGFFNIKGWFVNDNDSLMDLYTNKTCSLIPLFNKLEIEQDQQDHTKWYVTCLGYISMTFNKEYADYKLNEYVMLTYDMFRIPLSFTQNNSIKYETSGSEPTVDPCVGFIKKRENGIEKLYSLKTVDTKTYFDKNLPSNSKNWIN